MSGPQPSHFAFRPPRNEEELRRFVWAAYGVRIPDVQVCPNHSTPWRAFCDAYFARSPVCVWKASRKMGGKTFMGSLLGKVEAVCLGAEVNVLGGSGEQSTRVLETMDALWAKPAAPRYMLRGRPALRRVRLRNGGIIRALMASQRSVRGPHPSRLRIDECMASGTMVNTPRGSVPIESLCCGDEVYSLSEGGGVHARRVARVIFKGFRRTVRVVVSSGDSFYCTPEHPIWTSSGWKRAEETAHEAVRTLRDSEKVGCSRSPLHGLLQRERVGAGEPRLPDLRRAEGIGVHTLQRLLSPPALGEKEALRGLRREDQRNPSLWSLPQEVDERWRHGGTQRSATCRREGRPSKPRGDRRRGDSQFGGSEVQGTGSMGDAGHRHRRRGQGAQGGHRDTRGLLARPAESQGDRSQEDIPAAPRRFRGDHPPPGKDARVASAARVISVTPGPILPVWDISVERDHTFFAEGVAVHNCDEVDVRILDSALGQPADKGRIKLQVVLSSTHQYAFGTMTEVLNRAEMRGWPVHEWCWRETQQPHGWISKDEIARTRSVVSDEVWRVEYDLQEPNPDARAFDKDAVEAMFDRDLGYLARNDDTERIVIEPWVRAGRYVHGADWGRKRDWTVIVTLRIDCTPARLVAYQRIARKPWPVIIPLFADRLRAYRSRGPEDAAHDGTGLGDVVEGYLAANADPVILSGERRKMIMENYINAVDSGLIRCPYIEYMAREHRVCSRDDLFSSSKDAHPPDSVVAGALAWSRVGMAGPQGLLY